MKIAYKITVLWFLILFCLSSVPLWSQSSPIKVVVIDAGHGGHDPGAVGKSKTFEKDINLKLALKLGKLIQDNHKDIKVIYTRDKDVFVELRRRTEIANENHADLFISIHCNSAPNSTSYGTETFVMSSDNSTANLAVAQKENSAILLESNYETNYGGFDPNSVDAYIIFSLLQNKYLDQSTKFASKIQYQFRENVKLSDRGVKQAGFLVLWRTTMPSVLVEAGFLSNPKEEAFLGSEKGQNEIANAIYNAFNQLIKEKKGLMVEPAISISSDTSLPESQEEIKTPEIKTIDGVVFRVQISCLAENKRLNDPVFKGIQPIFMWKNGNYYCYAAGEETNYEEAKALLERIKSQGFPDAFLIAFKNGEKISIKEALKYLKN